MQYVIRIHNSNNFRRYDNLIIKGSQLDLGDKLRFASKLPPYPWEEDGAVIGTVVGLKIVELPMLAIRVAPQWHQRTELHEIAIIPQDSISLSVYGEKPFDGHKNTEGKSWAHGRIIHGLPETEERTDVALHYPSTLFNFCDVFVESSNDFYNIQNQLLLVSKPAI